MAGAASILSSICIAALSVLAPQSFAHTAQFPACLTKDVAGNLSGNVVFPETQCVLGPLDATTRYADAPL